ncbi:MAG: hypothetical protein KDD55_01520 [Bdellovibrionales bacterium]|nr:hypothetical protein [Bdellovibrionales bacterium]
MSLRILFLAESVTLAHVVRLRMLAEVAHRLGHEVLFASGEAYNHFFSPPPWKELRLPTRTPEEFHQALQKGECLFPFPLLCSQTENELTLFKETQPDLIISDLRPSASVSTRLKEIPLWILTNASWSPYLVDSSFPLPCMAPLSKLGPRGEKRAARIAFVKKLYQYALPLILRKQKSGLVSLRKKYGLPPLSDYRSLLSDGDKVLYADIPSLFHLHPLPSHHSFLGHIPWSPSTTLPPWSNSVGIADPCIFVSLGSSGSDVPLPLILEGLKDFSGEIVVASSQTQFHDPDKGVYVAPALPGDYFSKKSEVSITNGGSPSTYQALSEGTPVIGIASNMDQMLNMQHVHRSKAGILLRADTFTPVDLKLAIDEIHHSSTIQKQTQSVCSLLQETSFQNIFTHLLSSLNEHPSKQKVAP